jgi:hypothetical protein
MIVGLTLLAGSRGVCHERVKRPVVRFIDFYQATQEPGLPLSFWERVAYGLAIAVNDPPEPSASRGA